MISTAQQLASALQIPRETVLMAVHNTKGGIVEYLRHHIIANRLAWSTVEGETAQQAFERVTGELLTVKRRKV